MNKKQVIFGSVLLSFLLLAGCAKQQEDASPKKDPTFTYSKTQEKPFGEYAYQTDEAGIKQDAADRMKITLPPLLFNVQQLFEQQGAIKDTQMDSPVFSVHSQADQLQIREVTAFKGTDGKYWSYGEVRITYDFQKKAKKVKLTSQEFNFYNWIEDGQYHGKDLPSLVSDLAKELKIKEPKKAAETLQKKTQGKTPEQLKGKTIELYNDIKDARKTQSVGRALVVTYSADNGVIEKVSAAVNDFDR